MRYRGVVAARGREGVGGDLWLVDPTELCALAERPGDRGWTAVGGSGQWARSLQAGGDPAAGQEGRGRSAAARQGQKTDMSGAAGATGRRGREGGAMGPSDRWSPIARPVWSAVAPITCTTFRRPRLALTSSAHHGTVAEQSRADSRWPAQLWAGRRRRQPRERGADVPPGLRQG